jgi:hypothetical protein
VHVSACLFSPCTCNALCLSFSHVSFAPSVRMIVTSLKMLHSGSWSWTVVRASLLKVRTRGSSSKKHDMSTFTLY